MIDPLAYPLDFVLGAVNLPHQLFPQSLYTVIFVVCHATGLVRARLFRVPKPFSVSQHALLTSPVAAAPQPNTPQDYTASLAWVCDLPPCITSLRPSLHP